MEDTKSFVVVLLFCTVAVSNLIHSVDGVRNTRERNRNHGNTANAQTVPDPDRFLEQFGYLAKPPEGVSHDPLSRREAIKNFQRMVSLAVTGRLNKETRDKMAAPRCGVPDMVPPGTVLPPPGVALDPSNNPLNFHVPGYKWEKTDLTWKLERISNDGLSRGSHRREMTNALKYWSDVTPLTFREVSGTADLNIDFSVFDHGDGSSFDGPSGTLAHAFYPEDGRVHFDDSEEWTENTDRGTNLKIVAAHEFGHALGLGHSNVQGALMAPYYQGYEANYELPYDDTAGIQTLYGSSPSERTTTRRPRVTTTPRPSPGVTPTANTRESCTTKFGAVMQAHDSRIYVFNDRWVWRLNSWGLDTGYPTRSTKIFKEMPYHVGAAVYSWRTRYTYFFKGKRVWKFYGFDKIQKKTAKSSNYPAGVNSAYISRDGRIYLLTGSQYWEFDEGTLDVTTDRARPISSLLPGAPSNIEAAVRLNDGFLYLFKGAKYRKYDESAREVLPGYPREKAGPWMGPECGGSYQPK